MGRHKRPDDSVRCLVLVENPTPDHRFYKPLPGPTRCSRVGTYGGYCWQHRHHDVGSQKQPSSLSKVVAECKHISRMVRDSEDEHSNFGTY